MNKLGRNYSLLVEAGNHIDAVTVQPPMTIEFDINRTYFSSANHFSIRVYNLSEKNRNKIRKDVITFQLAVEDFRQISLRAGYGSNMPEILKGNVVQCWTVREGNNFITQIDGFDSGFAFVNGVTSTQYPQGTTNKAIISDMMTSLKDHGVSVGSIGDFPGTIGRGNSYNGNTTDILRELTGGAFYIDNGTAHALKDNECTDDKIIIINNESGLLGTPILEEVIVHVNILFEPNIKLNQRVLLESSTGSRFNGIYKVTGIHHKATMSDAVAGEAVTELSLVNGTFNPVASALGA